MTAWDDLGAGDRRETVAEALARWNAAYNPPKTEQQLAEELAAGLERQAKHDGHFASDFLTLGEQQKISRTLAGQYGFAVNDGWNE